MAKSFVFRPNGPKPTIQHTETDADGDLIFEETYEFKYMYGTVEGRDIMEMVLVPRKKNIQPPEEVMAYLRRHEEEYDFTIASQSRVDGEEVQYT